LPLQVRVGVATGIVVVGELIGSSDSSEHTVVGDTPNLAARLQGMARPDSVVIAEATRRLLGDLFELEDLGAQAFKGFTVPIRAFAALRARAIESRFDGLHVGGLTPQIGREEEIEILLRRWTRAKSAEGRVVLISGEPGIGKSRLAAALQELLSDEPHVCLRHFCSPQRTDSALYPFIARLERAAGFEREDDAKARLDKLEALLAKSGEVNAKRAGLLADLLGLAPEGRFPAPPNDPQRRREMTLAALLEELETLPQQRPALLIFDDAQWADSTSLELLDRMIERAARLPVLIVVTFRPEFSSRWVGQPHVVSLSLSRLTRRETAALVEGVTGGKSLPPEILDRIVQHTDGVPLFIEELTKSLLEGGLLREKGSAYALAIPSSLQDTLMARLDRLGGARQVAQTAAIIGRDFSYELLRAVTSIPEGALRSALRQLVQSELIFQHGDPPQARFTFKHALVQDAAYQSLLKTNRKIQHRRVAETLERLSPEMTETQPELLAYHYAEAGLAEPAILYWRKAGQRAAMRAANIEAIDHLRRGLSLLDALPTRAAHADEELGILLTLGPALMSTRTTAAPEIQEVYGRARQLARDAGKVAELFATVWGSSLVAVIEGNNEVARACTAELFGIARKQEDTGYLLQAHHAAWAMEQPIGNLKAAREHVEAGLPLYDQDAHRDHAVLYGGHDPAVCAYCLDARVRQVLGESDRALAQLDKGLALARQLTHPPTLIHALGWSAEVCFVCRDPAKALTVVSEWLPLATEFGSALGVANATMTRGWAKVMLGDIEAGIVELRDNLGRWRSIGSTFYATARLGRAVSAFIEAGEVDQCTALLAEAFQIMNKTGERWYEAELHRLQGVALAATSQAQLVEAEACFKKALNVARSQGARLFELRAAMALSRLPCDRVQRKRHKALLDSIRGAFTEGFHTPDLKEAAALLDELSG
jgi:predicted ATPase